jgi:hypothetical protein
MSDHDKMFKRLTELEIAACLKAFRDAAVGEAGIALSRHMIRVDMDHDAEIAKQDEFILLEMALKDDEIARLRAQIEYLERMIL